MAVFVLVFVAFLLRAFGQFLVGPRTATIIAGPLVVLAAALLIGVLGVALFAKLGLVSFDDASD